MRLRKARWLRSALAALILIALLGAVTFFRSQSHSPIFISDCGVGESQKPTSITLACADAGIYIDKITWSTWGGRDSVGSGIFHMNSCEPSCVEGKFSSIPVNFSVSRETYEKSVKKNLYSWIDIRSTNGKELLLGNDYYYTDLVTKGF